MSKKFFVNLEIKLFTANLAGAKGNQRSLLIRQKYLNDLETAIIRTKFGSKINNLNNKIISITINLITYL